MKRHKRHERQKQKQKQQEGFFSEFNWHGFLPSSPLWTGRRVPRCCLCTRVGRDILWGMANILYDIVHETHKLLHCHQIFSTNYPRRGEFATVLQRTYKLQRKWIFIKCKKAAYRSNPSMNGRLWGAYFARLWTRERTYDRGIDHLSSSRICVWI
jgi:hypothetical protein